MNLIPKPAHIEVTGGYFKVDSNLVFGNDQSGTIRYVVDESFNGGNPEGYALNVTEKGIELRAASKSGLFYGEQTLRQLYTSKGIPCVSIQDNPRFPYRGLHLDVSRHFFPKEEVMKLLNVMSYYKLNTLHIHLTDAGGWRIQMDKYPKLTTDVAFRTESDWQKWWDGKDRKYLPEGTPGAYGGYFTKEDIREIVDYATARHINIIPEIEFPGHSDEVFVAYPELSCAGKPYTTGDFCIGNEKSFTFMEDVLSEVIELFPSEYIHIGGDEAGKGAWKTCPKCQGLMRRNGMKDVDELQSYMIHRAEEFLISKGRKLIGWDEILEGVSWEEASERPGYLYQIEVQLLDENGKEVRWQEKKIRVKAEGAGELAGLESGNLSDGLENALTESRRTFAGQLLVFVRRKTEGEISVKIQAENCPEVSMRFT